MLYKFYLESYKGLSRDVWLLALVMFINRSGAMVLPFLSIYLNQEIDLSLTQCGIVMSFYGLGSVAGAFTGGVLTDMLGYYRVMLTSLLITAICFLWVMTLGSFPWLCAGFFTISFFADIFRPANLTAIEAFSKRENLTRSIGLIRLAVNLGYAFGPFLGGYIAAYLAYNYLFIFNALSVFLAGLFFFGFFRKKKKEVSDYKTKDETEIGRKPWHDVPYMLYLILLAVIIGVFFQNIYIVPLYYKDGLGFDESMVGLLMGMNGLLIFLVEMPLIYALEKYFQSLSLIMTGGLLIALGVLSLGLVQTAWLAATVFLLLITFGEILSFPFSNTYAMEFANERNRGKYMGFYTMTFSIAHVISPLLWLRLADNSGYNAVWYAGAMACLVASIAVYMIKVKEGPENANSPSSVTQAISTKVSK